MSSRLKLSSILCVVSFFCCAADTVTPAMNLQINPSWPADLQSNFNKIDSHNHTSSQGVAVPVGGMSFLAPLSVNNQSITTILNLQLADGGAGPSVPLALWFDGTNLWTEDGAGNKIQLTANGAINIPSTAGYVAGNLTVDGGVFSIKDGGCFNTSNGAVYCDDSSGDAVVSAVLNHDVVWQANNINIGSIDPINGLFIDAGKIVGSVNVGGRFSVNQSAFIDGGLVVWQTSYIDGGLTVENNMTVGNNLGNNYTVGIIGNKAPGVGSQISFGQQGILASTHGNLVTENISSGTPPTCSSLNACWGDGGCTVNTASTDTSGMITITAATTSSSCAANSSLATLVFSGAYNNIPATLVQLSGDSDAGATPALPSVFAQADAGAFILSNTAVFTPNVVSTYTFSYHVFGYTDGGF